MRMKPVHPAPQGCLGKPGDDEFSIVAFENYRTRVPMFAPKGAFEYGPWTMRGGFVLPPEIRESEIVCVDRWAELEKPRNLTLILS